MESLKPPTELSMTGNVAENWKRFKQRFTLFLRAIDASNKSDDRKIALLLHVAGPEALEVYNTFTFTADQEGKYDAVLAKFETYCTPRKNETYERHLFLSRHQREGESIEQWVTDLRLKSQSCAFGDLATSLITLQVILSIRDCKLQERLLREDKLDLEKTVQMCKAAEMASQQLHTIGQGQNSDVTVHACTKQSKQGHGGAYPKHRVNPQHRKQTVNYGKKDNYGKLDSYGKKDNYGKQDKNLKQNQSECGNCGKFHPYGLKHCYAFGKYCGKCGKLGHLSPKCRSTDKSVHTVNATEEDEEDTSEQFFLHSIELGEDIDEQTVHAVHQPEDEDNTDWYETIMVNGDLMPFKLDCGAQCNLMPISDYRKLTNKPKITSGEVKVYDYNTTPIRNIGKCIVQLQHRGKTVNALFVIVKEDRPAILGKRDCVRLGLIKRIYEITTTQGMTKDKMKEHFPDLFQGIGCLEGEHMIRLKEDAVPTQRPAHRIPIALKGRLKKELDRMEACGIIRKITDPTDWVNTMVIVEKKDTLALRICLDPKDLNQAIQREHYQLPTKTEILSDMSGAKFFSKLDANSGFYQIKISSNCQPYTIRQILL